LIGNILNLTVRLGGQALSMTPSGVTEFTIDSNTILQKVDENIDSPSDVGLDYDCLIRFDENGIVCAQCGYNIDIFGGGVIAVPFAEEEGQQTPGTASTSASATRAPKQSVASSPTTGNNGGNRDRHRGLRSTNNSRRGPPRGSSSVTVNKSSISEATTADEGSAGRRNNRDLQGQNASGGGTPKGRGFVNCTDPRGCGPIIVRGPEYWLTFLEVDEQCPFSNRPPLLIPTPIRGGEEEEQQQQQQEPTIP
jgi:hypothetical protein